MVTSAIVAYLHYLGFMLSFGALVLERRLLKAEPSINEAKLMIGTDIVYGLAALTILVTGVLRVLYFGQGVSFYMHNPVFLTKVSLYLAIGGLSLYPTVSFIRWAFPLRDGKAPVISEATAKRLGWVLNIEIAAFVILPLLAALMARGIGLQA